MAAIASLGSNKGWKTLERLQFSKEKEEMKNRATGIERIEEDAMKESREKNDLGKGIKERIAKIIEEQDYGRKVWRKNKWMKMERLETKIRRKE